MDCGEYYINSGFKTMLEIDRILYHTNYDENEKQAKIITLFYPIGEHKNLFFPTDLEESVIRLFDFKTQKGKIDYAYIDDGKPPTLSYFLDGDAIYSDFLREYRIDLQTEDIHWYKFLALLVNLSGNSTLNAIRDIRSRDVSKVPKEEQNELLRRQKIYAISNEFEDIYAEFNKKLLQECEKTGDFARYRREKRG